MEVSIMVARTDKEKALDELARGVKELRISLAKLTDNMRRHNGDEHLRHLREQVRSGLDAVANQYESIKADSQQAVETAQHKVRERPLASLAISFGIGWIFGRLMRGGRRR